MPIRPVTLTNLTSFLLVLLIAAPVRPRDEEAPTRKGFLAPLSRALGLDFADFYKEECDRNKEVADEYKERIVVEGFTMHDVIVLHHVCLSSVLCEARSIICEHPFPNHVNRFLNALSVRTRRRQKDLRVLLYRF